MSVGIFLLESSVVADSLKKVLVQYCSWRRLFAFGLGIGGREEENFMQEDRKVLKPAHYRAIGYMQN